MLNGTAELAAIEREAPTVNSFDTAPVVLEHVELLQLLYEIDCGALQTLLPPALHPTLPPVVAWSVYRVSESPWGAFQLAQARIECRSGLRPRGYLLGGLIDNETAAAALARGWGYRLRPGTPQLRRNYHEIRARVFQDRSLVLDLALRNPIPLAPRDLQFVASMHPAHTPLGFRLVQVEPNHDATRAERGAPHVMRFAPTAVGAAQVELTCPISAMFCLASVTIPPVRYVCRPDVSAFEGTERLR
ncbi:MAG: acetoacetate decarboxylase family protein [Candidatus Binatia bacterium]